MLKTLNVIGTLAVVAFLATLPAVADDARARKVHCATDFGDGAATISFASLTDNELEAVLSQIADVRSVASINRCLSLGDEPHRPADRGHVEF